MRSRNRGWERMPEIAAEPLQFTLKAVGFPSLFR